jgi:hypothetical protein
MLLRRELKVGRKEEIFTSFHMGRGLLFKALFLFYNKHFSSQKKKKKVWARGVVQG